jgi:diguanylate cyclase (GGDEF)-like protein
MDDEKLNAEDLLAEVERLRAQVADLERGRSEHSRALASGLHDATHDLITGLYNHAHVIEHLALAIRSAKRYHYPLSICVVRMDGLSAVYDTQGTDVAEELLCEFGRLVIDELRGDDIGGRYGQEGFCIVFPHTMPANAALGMERVRRAFNKLVADLPIQVAFGVAGLVSGDMQPADLLADAEKAVTQARASGGDRIVVHVP